MSVYLIADIQIRDGSWVPDYAATVHKIVGRHGGRYLSRSGNIETLEGNPPESTVIALIEFPSARHSMALRLIPNTGPLARPGRPAALVGFA